MTSKEYLKRIDEKNYLTEREHKEFLSVIEKDLDMLEIIKKYLYYSNKSHCIRMREIRKRQSNFDYEELKEWLENDR